MAHTPRQRRMTRVLLSLGCLGIVGVVFAHTTRNFTSQAIIDDSCIGQIYLTQGCPPVDPDPRLPPPVPTTCGNGILETGEECDGSKNCQNNCQKPVCGNGILQPSNNETCEPDPVLQIQYIYDTYSTYTGEYTVRKEFIQGNMCGKYCTVPTCTTKKVNNGGGPVVWETLCSGGCDTRIGASCEEEVEVVVEKPAEEQPIAQAQQQSSVAVIAPYVPPTTFAAPAPVCGNGVLETGEQCDDANLRAGDGCSRTCAVERCGDGLVQVGEQCDDSNTFDNDGCSSQCQRERCGDGKQQAGEQCDDSNALSDDGCSAACRKESCGDGFIQATEECDDRNTRDGDGCSVSCKLEFCGDGKIQEGAEQCDDGNKVDVDGCSNACKIARCGDALIQAGEECDDANLNDADNCSNICKLGRCGDAKLQIGEQCDDGNTSAGDGCSAMCRLPSCGDGTVESGEQCDDANRNDVDSCTNACQLPRCGDGLVQTSEECDDGNRDDSDSCPNSCKLPKCGNGVPEGSEECDAGSRNSNTKEDACRLDCKEAFCGDGVTDDDEDCDGGNNCDARCVTIAGAAASVNSSQPSSLQPLVTTDVAPSAPTSSTLPIVLGSLGALAVAAGGGWMFYRKKLAHDAAGSVPSGAVLGIDDIPLDELEMPSISQHDKDMNGKL